MLQTTRGLTHMNRLSGISRGKVATKVTLDRFLVVTFVKFTIQSF